MRISKWILASALILFISSCKKDNSLDCNCWKFKGTIYNTSGAYVQVKSSFSTNNALSATSIGNSTPFCTIDFNFKDIPTSAGTYNIVNYNATLGPKDVALGAVINDGKLYPEYLSIGNNGATANVEIKNGLMTVSISGATMALSPLRQNTSTLIYDTAVLSTNVTQTR